MYESNLRQFARRISLNITSTKKCKLDERFMLSYLTHITSTVSSTGHRPHAGPVYFLFTVLLACVNCSLHKRHHHHYQQPVMSHYWAWVSSVLETSKIMLWLCNLDVSCFKAIQRLSIKLHDYYLMITTSE